MAPADLAPVGQVPEEKAAVFLVVAMVFVNLGEAASNLAAAVLGGPVLVPGVPVLEGLPRATEVPVDRGAVFEEAAEADVVPGIEVPVPEVLVLGDLPAAEAVPADGGAVF
ncbi:MAG: hypothetical protein ACOZFS_14580 [Thermodesulfobacteriota bacterium]